jgi:hypothetical protein
MGSRLVLEILGALCKFECSANQDLMREQAGFATVNMVADILQYLMALYRGIDITTFPMVISALQTLRHIAQGNAANQRLLLDRRVLIPINHLIHQQVGCARGCSSAVCCCCTYTN